jgi:hypothetical protein
MLGAVIRFAILAIVSLVSANWIHGSANAPSGLRQTVSATNYPVTSVSAAEVLSYQATQNIYAVNHLQIVLPNVVGETNTGGTLTCSASARYPAVTGPFNQFTFGGNASGSTTGDFLTSDVISVSVAANSEVEIYVWCSNSANVIPGMNQYETGTSLYQGVTQFGTTVPNYTMGGGFPSNTSNGFQFGAVVIAGDHTHPAVAVWGDSIAYGIGESGTSTGDTPNGGVIVPSIISTVPTANYGIPGDSIGSWVSGHAKRIQLAQYFSSFINEYGVNDFNFGESAATVEGYVASMTSALASYGPLISITIGPSGGSSSDNYSTTAGQTPCGCNAQKQIYNTWVRGLTPHYFEVAGALEFVQGDGIWIVNGTASNSPWSDVHPTGSTGYPAVYNSGNVNPAWIQ